MLELAHLADPRAEAETAGLIPSFPLLRPADILTSAALPGRLAALDIGVVSPDAGGAGRDCCDFMYKEKMQDYQRHLAELQEADIIYRPLIWSAWGRAHAETDAILEALARAAARRRGLRDHHQLLQRTRDAIGVMLVRRAVRMVRSCLASPEGDELNALVRGRGPLATCSRTVKLVAGCADAN